MNVCSICLENINDSIRIKPFKCDHEFHSECVNKWINDYSKYSCPYCRAVKEVVFETPLLKKWSNGHNKLVINETSFTRYWSNGNIKIQINLEDNTGDYYYSDNSKKIKINEIENSVLEEIKVNDYYIYMD